LTPVQIPPSGSFRIAQPRGLRYAFIWLLKSNASIF